MEEKNNKTLADWLKTPPAKRGAKAMAVSTVLRGKHVQDDFEAFGVTYTLRTLEPWEETWADGLVPAGSGYQTGQAIPRAYLAAALVAIDGSPVEAEFQVPDELDPEMRKILVGDDVVLRDWRTRQVFAWVQHDLQPEVIETLWQGYVTLCMRRKSLLEGLVRLSTRTPSSGSSGTSLLEKESSSPIPRSAA